MSSGTIPSPRACPSCHPLSNGIPTRNQNACLALSGEPCRNGLTEFSKELDPLSRVLGNENSLNSFIDDSATSFTLILLCYLSRPCLACVLKKKRESIQRNKCSHKPTKGDLNMQCAPWSLSNHQSNADHKAGEVQGQSR